MNFTAAMRIFNGRRLLAWLKRLLRNVFSECTDTSDLFISVAAWAEIKNIVVFVFFADIVIAVFVITGTMLDLRRWVVFNKMQELKMSGQETG